MNPARGGGGKYCTLYAGDGKILDSITLPPFESRFTQTYTMVIALSALCIEQAHAARLKSIEYEHWGTLLVVFNANLQLLTQKEWRLATGDITDGFCAFLPLFHTSEVAHLAQPIGLLRWVLQTTQTVLLAFVSEFPCEFKAPPLLENACRTQWTGNQALGSVRMAHMAGNRKIFSQLITILPPQLKTCFVVVLLLVLVPVAKRRQENAGKPMATFVQCVLQFS